MGTHAELLAQGGHYYRLYTQQFRQELVEPIDEIAALFADAEGAEANKVPVSEKARTNGKLTKAELVAGD
jgi:hypothetical protein